MAKDPAFLFYPNDYLGGTLGMTFEEKGAYMELLMLQFNRGHMTSHMIGQVVGQLWVNIQVKFVQDENGLWYNKRLDDEIAKRIKFTESRRNNLKGVNQYNKKEKQNGHKGGHMTSHMENENENRNINRDENENLKTQKIQIENPFGLAGKRIWDAWKAYKKDEHKKTYKSAKTEQTALNSLYEMSGGNVEIAGQIIQQSITNQWQGFFELKKQNNVKPTKSLREQVAEEFAKRYPD